MFISLFMESFLCFCVNFSSAGVQNQQRATDVTPQKDYDCKPSYAQAGARHFLLIAVTVVNNDDYHFISNGSADRFHMRKKSIENSNTKTHFL